jgi:hypothetical protein
LDLEYNTDLLGFLTVTGPNTVSFSDGHLHLSANQSIVSDNGILATLAFQVYLTTEDTTNVSIANIHLNNFDPAFEQCIATASAQGNSVAFTSTYSCGDKSISDYLRSSSLLQLTSLYPNPAINILSFDVNSKIDQEIHITVFDAFGRKKLIKQIAITAGRHSLPLDLTQISSGIYVVEIANGVSKINTQFIKIQ